jgi:hypothetical protein
MGLEICVEQCCPLKRKEFAWKILKYRYINSIFLFCRALHGILVTLFESLIKLGKTFKIFWKSLKSMENDQIVTWQSRHLGMLLLYWF